MYWQVLVGSLRLMALGLQLGASGDLPILQVASQGDQQLPRQGHNAELAPAFATVAEPALIQRLKSLCG